MKGLLNIVIMAWLSSILGCKQNPVVPIPGTDLSQVLVQMVDYASVRVSDNGNVTRALNDVDHIGFGLLRNGQYVELLAFIPLLTKENNSYRVAFDTLFSIPDTTLSETIRFRMYLTTGTTVDKDTVLLPYKYPYNSTEVVLAGPDLGYQDAIVQDIAFVGDTMYILHIGDSRLFRLEPGQVTAQFYHDIMEADFLAGDSSYIYIDNNIQLARFNTNSKSFDHVLRELPPPYLTGLAAENGRVYALYPSGDIIVLDRQGQVLDSMRILFSAFHIAVYAGVVYANGYSSNTIPKYDTIARSIVGTLVAPASNIEGMEIHQGFLYYGDYLRKTIMRVSLSELNAQPAPTNGPA